MKNKIFICAIFAFISLLIPACSSVQQSAGREEQKNKPGDKKDSLYVFDQASAKDTAQIQNKSEIQTNGGTFYLIQIGAFSTKERADEFADSSKSKIQDEIAVSFKTGANLYVVRLSEHYASHDEAVKKRDILWKIPDFKDAWIVTEQQ
jgi:hypothetical protein